MEGSIYTFIQSEKNVNLVDKDPNLIKFRKFIDSLKTKIDEVNYYNELMLKKKALG